MNINLPLSDNTVEPASTRLTVPVWSFWTTLEATLPWEKNGMCILIYIPTN